MVLPLIPLVAVAVGAATGGGGAILGGIGVWDIKRARSELGAATLRYEERRASSEELVESVNQRIVEYGDQQETAIRGVVARMHNFLVRNEKKVRNNEKLFVDGIEATVNLVDDTGSVDLSATTWAGGLLASVSAGAGVSVGTTTLVTSFASASTGTAIAGLSGAAAQSATLAWLGGGSIAAGGGGIAAGAMALNFVTIGPGLLVAGLVTKGEGRKAVTQARAHIAAIDVEIANLDAADAALAAVMARADELSAVLTAVTDRADESLDELESEPFDPIAGASLFHQTLALVRGVVEIATTPVINDDGKPTEIGHDLVVKYRSTAVPPTGSNATGQAFAAPASQAHLCAGESRNE